MPDCLLKYQIILKRARERNEKFTDKNFAGDEALGPVMTKNFDKKYCGWLRVSEF
jgi:hypothetical protein